MADVIKNNVQFVGLRELEPFDQKRVKEVIFTEFEKIEREFKNIESMKVHFKPYKKEGAKKKFSLHILVKAASHPISAELKPKTGAWDPVKAIHQVLEKARKELVHKFSGDTTHPGYVTKKDLTRLR